MSVATVTDLTARLERSVLGAALRDETCRRVLLGSLGERDYGDLSHGAVHAALVRLTGASESVDWENVLRVGDRRLLGRVVASDLAHAGRSVTAEKVSNWARHLRAQSAARRASLEIEDAIAWLRSPSSVMEPTGFLERVARALTTAQLATARESGADAPAIAQEVDAYLTSTQRKELSTGMRGLDSLLGGLYGGKFYVIGGRSSVGKTAAACTVTRSACEWDASRRPYFFSLEMLRRELAVRWLAGLSGLDSRAIERRTVAPSHPSLLSALQRFSRWPLVVDDTERLTIGDLCARATVAHSIHPLSLVMVDYVQLVRPSTSSRQQSREREVAEISGELKALSKTLDVPVVALAQLNREGDKQQDKRPILSDLSESDAIVHDADAVVLLHREHLYDKSVSPEKAEAIVAKNRGGVCGTVELRYLANQVLFADAEGVDVSADEWTNEGSEGA